MRPIFLAFFAVAIACEPTDPDAPDASDGAAAIDAEADAGPADCIRHQPCDCGPGLPGKAICWEEGGPEVAYCVCPDCQPGDWADLACASGVIDRITCDEWGHWSAGCGR